MAVVIASELAKDIAGAPLLRGVSFKLERRDRMTIAGRNGAGKTTLLRMLAGEASVDGGELVLAKGTRVALHDQRPPRQRDVSLREYVLSGRREPLELEAELRRLEEAMAGGDEAAMARYAAAAARFGALGGYNWRARRRRGGEGALPRGARALRGARRLHLARAGRQRRPRPRVRRRRLRPPAGHVLRRPAHPRLAGPRAGRRGRPPPARRAHEPPR